MAEIPTHRAESERDKPLRSEEMKFIADALRAHAAHVILPETGPIDMSAELAKPSVLSREARHKKPGSAHS